jgi:ABC-2 type transport system permease protein
MATAAVTYSVSTNDASRTLAVYGKETKYEFLKLLRAKSFSLAMVGFPLMFYVLFGLSNKHVYEGSVYVTKYMLGGYATFGLIGAALFGIGVGLSSELNSGWLELKRASPMPVPAYLFAKCAAAVVFGIAIVSILTAVGVAFGGVTLTSIELAKMLGMTVAGSIAFASMGLLLALLVPANAAPGIVNLIYLPMSYLSGLWMPIRFMPHWLQHIAPLLPTYHLAQLMLSVYGYQEPGSSLATHWNALVGFTLVMLGTFWMIFSRKERNA